MKVESRLLIQSELELAIEFDRLDSTSQYAVRIFANGTYIDDTMTFTAANNGTSTYYDPGSLRNSGTTGFQDRAGHFAVWGALNGHDMTDYHMYLDSVAIEVTTI